MTAWGGRTLRPASVPDPPCRARGAPVASRVRAGAARAHAARLSPASTAAVPPTAAVEPAERRIDGPRRTQKPCYC
jgi:hypothetical protein